MGSTVSNSDHYTTNQSEKLVNQSYFEGTNNEYGTVYVKSRKLKVGFGVHHYIAVCVPGQVKWLVYEFMNYGLDMYACKEILGQTCFVLGHHYVKDVYNAVKKATSYGKYSVIRNNCNDWTCRVASLLGYKINVKWTCHNA